MIPLHLNSAVSPNLGGDVAVGSDTVESSNEPRVIISMLGPRFASSLTSDRSSMRRGHVSLVPNKSHSLVRAISLLKRPTLHRAHTSADVAAVMVEKRLAAHDEHCDSSNKP